MYAVCGKDATMPGTRTAPTVNGTPTWLTLSITMYDYTGQQRTDSYQIDADATDAEIEAIVVAQQALMNGTIWRVTVGQVYNSVGDSSNALEEVWEDRKDNVVFLAKDSMNNGFDWFVPSPVNAMFTEGTENIDPTYGATGTLLAAILAVKTGFSIVSGRFTHRRSIGSKVNI